MSTTLPITACATAASGSQCLRRWLGALILGIAMTATSGGAVAALQDGQKFKDWTAKCLKPKAGEGETICGIVQLVSRPNTSEPFLAVEVGYPRDGDIAIVSFTVPLGILLPVGVHMQIDDSENTANVPFTVCVPGGCRAMLKLNEETLGMFKRGTVLKITVADTRGGTLTLPVSLRGFTAGINALK